MRAYLQRLVDYNCWANEELIAFLRTVPGETLDATAAGVYGSIRTTLEHLLASELRYCAYLKTRGPAAFAERAGNLDLDALQQMCRESAANLRNVVEALPDAGTMVPLRDGKRAAATILAQLFMHGCEHRAHVGTVLGSLGIEPPDIDAWAHGIFVGGDEWPGDWGPEPATRTVSWRNP